MKKYFEVTWWCYLIPTCIVLMILVAIAFIAVVLVDINDTLTSIEAGVDSLVAEGDDFEVWCEGVVNGQDV